MADNIEAVAKKLYEKARQSSVLLSEQLHRFVKDPDPRYEVFTKPLPEWGELDGTLKEIYLIEARQIDTLCQKRIEQVFEFLENEFGYFDEPNELAKIIIDDGGYYGSEGRMKKYLKFRAKYLAKIKEE